MCLQCVTAYLIYNPEEVSFVNEPSIGRDFFWISIVGTDKSNDFDHFAK